ncbi:hypothetical protein [Nodosilinea sp. E11]|uniref:hypothetical protein n=1 Tax=Nodosilinea sp. E11 TaxID=3037479 RepID=UPI002935239A|nr:hypothetical protein [Nodosilinea sp. E11]WOD39726.1 hypothetical protein RRF56_02815 [Nodosilinea sp. E11]
MPTVAELERLQALISRLTPLAQRQRGELIQAQDWNALVGVVIEVARAVLAEAAPDAVPPHEHPDQVKLAWLDPRLRTLLEKGPLSDPGSTAKLSELERRINRVPTQVTDLKDDLQTFRNQINSLVSRDLQRESDLTVVRRQFEGLPNTRDDILTLREDLSGMRTNVQRVLELSDSLTVNGQPVDFETVTNRINSLESFRERLRTPTGDFLDATRLEQRLTELTNTLVTEAELDAAFNSRPGRISDAQVGDLRAQLTASLANDLRVSTGQLRQELQTDVANRLAQVDGLVSQAIAGSLPSISESVLGSIRAEVNANLQSQLEGFQTGLDQRFTAVEGRLAQTLGQQAEGLVAAALDRQLPDRLGQLQSNLAGLAQQFTQLQTQLREQTTRLGGLDSRLGQFDTRLQGLDSRIEGRFGQLSEQTRVQVGEAIAPLRDELRSELGAIARESAVVESRAALSEVRGDLRGVVQNELAALTPQFRSAFVTREDLGALRTEFQQTGATKAELGALQTEVRQTFVTRTDLNTFQTQFSQTMTTQVNQLVNTRIPAVVTRELERSTVNLPNLVDRAVTERMREL